MGEVLFAHVYGMNAIPAPLPAPWSIEEGAACFIVRDHDKQALAYVNYENEAGRRSRSCSRGTRRS
jgi:hypothetical protein